MSVVYWVEQLLILEMTSHVPSFACMTLLLVWEAAVILQEAGSWSSESPAQILKMIVIHLCANYFIIYLSWYNSCACWRIRPEWEDRVHSKCWIITHSDMTTLEVKKVPWLRPSHGHIPGSSSSSERSGSDHQAVWLFVLMTAGGLTFLCADLNGDPTAWKIQ